MARSIKKGFFTDEKLMKKVLQKGAGDKSAIKTWSRASTITPEMIGLHFEVHNGKSFIKVFVGEEMVGHKLGEFSPTRKFVRHGGKIQKEIDMKKTAGDKK